LILLLPIRENPHDLLECPPLQPCPFALAVCVYLAPHRAPERAFAELPEVSLLCAIRKPFHRLPAHAAFCTRSPDST
jgi:hypothetical protein